MALVDLVPAAWLRTLEPEWSHPYFASLSEFVDAEYSRTDSAVYPDRRRVFEALRLCPLADLDRDGIIDRDAVKVVILGQDPYPTTFQTRRPYANGLAFSVDRDARMIPPSLQNIYAELQADAAIVPRFVTPSHGDLGAWARQGVLLLNTVLTVRRGDPRSHADVGWERFTTAVLRAVNDHCDGVVFMLWGRDARQKASCVDARRHLVLEAAHPSPKSEQPFVGCRHFSRANAYLRSRNRAPIDWTVL